jgi:hypothetical protein
MRIEELILEEAKSAVSNDEATALKALWPSRQPHVQ